MTSMASSVTMAQPMRWKVTSRLIRSAASRRGTVSTASELAVGG